ncbi:AAA family ATPase [Polymorphobacter sp.]|uniref:AAA family ATPase n=1 Tax=Polymorphobacter sp. TaxID=1909290 RepID=UPI003F72755B
MASKPQDRPTDIDIDTVRQQLVAHKLEKGVSWGDLAARIGIAQGTLSNFGIDKYEGDNLKVATSIVRWFQAEKEQATLRAQMTIDAPSFQMTRAAREITAMLRWAQRGKFVVVASSPGFGKTSALDQYQVDTPQVWKATMAPSTSGVPTMLTTILASMGDKEARGTPLMLSGRIRQKVRNTGGLIALDEAQHLTLKALEELRSIHDATGVGIALLGNAELLQLLEGTSRATSHAQLFGRVSMRIVKNLAYPEDGVMLGRAWGIANERMLKWLGEQTVKPGGLRSVSFTIELAMMLASGEGRELAFEHLRDAWAQLSHRPHSN